ncbi:MAG: S8 family serine peptidase [Lewinellaceae bacterium]|nr:S8 family serine peptidase [Phaeodactylibacter sp.]MCB9037840.1 S8 family serine peptidase [Lewinellaceae bacterium]
MVFLKLPIHAQVIVNESWSSAFGSLPEIGWSVSEIGENGNIYTVGHEQAAGRVQFSLAGHDSEGNLLWASGLEASGISFSFGTALLLDGQGNIYCAGAAVGPGTNGYDLLVAKFDTSGNQSWYILIDGPEELDDYGLALLSVDAENLMVAGLSSSSEGGQDILAVMASDEGDVVWQSYYDYAQKDDAPIDIEIFDESNVEILGASQDANGDWDILSWRLPIDDGEPGSDYRYPFLKLDYEKGVYCEKDSQGNYYFSGAKTSEAGGLDMQLIKLDASFELEWAKEIDSGFGDDVVFSTVFSPEDAAVYLGGYRANRQGGQDMYVASFSSAGDLSIEHQRVNNQPASKAAARAIRLAADGDIYAAGEAQAGGDKELVITRFDKEAGQLWEVKAGLVANPERQSFSLLADGQGRLLFSGAVQEVESQKYVLKALEELDLDREVVFSEDSIPHYIKGEVIIRFASPVLDSSFVDNTKLHYGPLCEVVTDTALLNEMEQLLEPAPGQEVCDCQLVKVFPGLTTEELCITTLDGNPLYIPPFWTTMLLKNCTTGKNELAVSAGLDSISAGRIIYAHPNFVGTGNADCEDPLCDEQHSLWDTPNTDYSEEASINILPAWDHSTGKPEVKVGLFDSGIFYQHEDFGYGSVVEESWDFVNGSSQNVITTSEDSTSHGTRGAGIIGAIRGNDIGIAGIAGGDTGSPGVTLLGFRVLTIQNMWAISKYADALLYALRANGSPMIGLANNSLSVQDDGSSANDVGLLEEAVNLAFRAGVSLIASRGNGFDGGDLTLTQYPCSFDDEITICVGSTGTDGELKYEENGDPDYPGPGDDSYSSMYGDPMDLLAPGSGGLIKTTTNADQGYGGHTGTSAAAPHATGVAALLASASEQVRLSVEDLEHIMQYTADDLESPFYDQRTAWGRLNAGAALEFIQENRVLHFSAVPGRGSRTFLSSW